MTKCSQTMCAQTIYKRGREFYAKKDYGNAIKEFDQAIMLDPADPQFYRFRGISYFLTGQYDKAIDNYTGFIALDSSPYPVLCRGNMTKPWRIKTE